MNVHAEPNILLAQLSNAAELTSVYTTSTVYATVYNSNSIQIVLCIQLPDAGGSLQKSLQTL